MILKSRFVEFKRLSHKIFLCLLGLYEKTKTGIITFAGFTIAAILVYEAFNTKILGDPWNLL